MATASDRTPDWVAHQSQVVTFLRSARSACNPDRSGSFVLDGMSVTRARLRQEASLSEVR